MRTHSTILFVVFLVSGLSLYGNAAFAQQKAFAEAEGYGAFVTGGRGGTVYHVTNLNDSGAGSLRDAVSSSNRIIVFDICGVINPTSGPLVFSNNITLAGQTAPGDGITIYGNYVSLSNRNNIILRDIRIRPGVGTASDKKGLNITSGYNMIIDHVSVEWSRYDNIGITQDSGSIAPYNITIQNCICGEAIQSQYAGMLVDSSNYITLSHNLFLDNKTRNPKAKGTIQYINNVVYNWGSTDGLTGGHSSGVHYLDCINNYFIQGPSSSSTVAGQFNSNDYVYQSGNMKDMNKNGVLDGVAMTTSDFSGGPTFYATKFFNPTIPVTTDSAAVAYSKVAAGAGASLSRDPVDTRLVNQVTSLGTLGAVITDESVVGGQPAMTVVTRSAGFDTDNDGIPNTWETAHGLNPSNANDRNTLNPVGYTYIEQYINEIAANHASRTWNSNGGDWGVTVKWTATTPTSDDKAYVVGDGTGAGGLVNVMQNNAACFHLYIGGNGSSAGDKVTVNGGTLSVNDTVYVGDQGNGTLEINSGTVRAWNIQLGNTVGGTTYTGSLLLNGGTLKTYQVVLGGGTPGNWNSGGSCIWSGGAVQAIGTLMFAVPAAIGAGGATIDSNGFACAVSGILSGEGGLTKLGSGTLALTAANTYTGDTTISNGTLELTSRGQLYAASSISTSSSATFQVDSGTHTVGDISGTGVTNLAAGGNLTASSVVQGTLTIGAGATLTIAFLPGGPQSVNSSTTPVPEPSTITLLIAAVLGIMFYLICRITSVAS
ncbi:MAG: autotransporter-associated beta strand repeat-containing protein [Thermoguttaceae bacterium]|jgi:autotransporter-associated beta strand protein/T5SS/PEP-CTERM-associated repeat protein